MKTCYFLPIEQQIRPFTPSVVQENTEGHYPTNWSWDTDRETADQLIKAANEGLGISEDEARDIIYSSVMKTPFWVQR